MKTFLRVLILILLAAALWYGYQYFSHARYDIEGIIRDSQDQHKDQQGDIENLISDLKETKKEQTATRVYSILAAGDMMLDRGVEAKVNGVGEGDYNFSFDLIRDDLLAADYVFANLEGSMSDVGADTGKPYSFRFDPSSALALKNAGIDLVSLANNHMLDWGRDSLCETTKNLDAADVDYVGAGCDASVSERPHIQTFGNTRVAFLAYTEFYKGAHATEGRPGMSEYNLDKIETRIKDIKENNQADLVMVSMHWGAEYKPRANDFQVTTGQALVDMGADVVIGHHPHVDQEIERYGDGWIIYSLGNFVFDQSWSEETMLGLIADIQIQDGRVYDIVPKPIQLNSNFQPYIL